MPHRRAVLYASRRRGIPLVFPELITQRITVNLRCPCRFYARPYYDALLDQVKAILKGIIVLTKRLKPHVIEDMSHSPSSNHPGSLACPNLTVNHERNMESMRDVMIARPRA